MGDARGLPLRTVDDARIRRIVGLLPPLHGPAQRRGARRERGGRVLAQRRPLRGRHRARHGSPDVLALLEHVPLRPGLRLRGGAVPQTRQPGHDPGALELRLPHRGNQQVRVAGPQGPVRDAGALRRREHRPQRHPRPRRLPRMDARIQGRRIHPRGRQVRLRLGHRENVEVVLQRREPRLHRRQLRRRHAAHVRDVPRTAGAVETLGHERHRRRAQIPAPLLAPVLRPRRAAVRHG